jgi:RHS repeat-associated protein
VKRAYWSLLATVVVSSIVSQAIGAIPRSGANPPIQAILVKRDFRNYRPAIVLGHPTAHLPGHRIVGPMMLERPLLPTKRYPDPAAIRAVRESSASRRPFALRLIGVRPFASLSPTPWPTATPFPSPTPTPTATPSPGPTPSGSGSSVDSHTGQKPWSTIVMAGIGGVGSYGVDVVTGNLLVQAPDMFIANAGVPLALIRAYNSFSKHDAGGDDGSAPSIYGQYWTNTWDAHIAFSGNNNIVVWDGLGTAYDYTADVNDPGTWDAPAGISDQLQYDGGNGYFWIHPDGSEDYFYSPNQQSQFAAFSGRLYAIYGRNRNTSIYFEYAFNPNASSSNNITEIEGVAQDGRTTQLDFELWGSYNELTTLIWPDGTQVAYHYNTSTGDLTQVDEPGNGSTSVVSQAYAYNSSTGTLAEVQTPNYVMSSDYGPGSKIDFTYSNSNTSKVVGVAYTGIINFTPSDGTNTLLDPSATPGSTTYKQITVSYQTDETTLSDTDSHTTRFEYNSSNEVTSISANTGDASPGPGSLTETVGWYSSSDPRARQISSITDARGDETDFTYDNLGDLEGIGEPAVPVKGASPRPTTWISYDSNHNIIAVCDPNYDNANNLNWGQIATPAPAGSPTPCPMAAGTAQTTLKYPTNNGYEYEPFGEVYTQTDPSGYTTTYTYASASQGGVDLGLTTGAQGAKFMMNGTYFQPSFSAVYDLSGDILCAESGSGHWVTAQYDEDGRMLALGDADDYVVNGSACGKSQGAYADAQHYVYYPNGEVEETQNAVQFPSNGDTFTYDGDGNLTQSKNWFANTQNTTTYLYDAADRNVEVEEPQDASNDFYSMPWLTRYLYDLGAIGGSTEFMGSTVVAHGNLYKMQRYLPSAIQSGDATPPTPTPSWVDSAATAYDELDRVTDQYQPISGQTTGTVDHNYLYDAADPNVPGSSPAPGLVTEYNHGFSGEYLYDALGRVSETFFYCPSGPHCPFENPGNQYYTYDADGDMLSACCGIGSEDSGYLTYTFDADQRLTREIEPTPQPSTTPYDYATLTYDYYPNGWPESTSYSALHDSSSGSFSYVYRDDGLLSEVTLDSNKFGTYSINYNYTPGGRPWTKSDTVTSSHNTTTWGYDQYGRVSSLYYPDYNTTAIGYSSVTYDLENDVTQYVYGGYTDNLTFSTRGELVALQSSEHGTGSPPWQQFKSADGVLYPPDKSVCYSNNCGALVTNFDARDGAPLGTLWTPAPSPSPQPTQNTVIQYNQLGFNEYDDTTLNGTSIGSASYYWNGQPWQEQVGSDGLSFAYRSDGRLGWENLCTPCPTTNDSEYFHWNGNEELFSSDVSGDTDDFKFDTDGDIVPNDEDYTSITMWDRDLFGDVGGAHNASASPVGNSKWMSESPYTPCAGGPVERGASPSTYKGPAAFGGPLYASCENLSALAFEARPDGQATSLGVLQGDRYYNPGTASWTSADQTASLSGDPIGDLPYIYDRNDPSRYFDPSGNDAVGPVSCFTSGKVESGGTTWYYYWTDWDCLAEALDPGFEPGFGIVNANPNIYNNARARLIHDSNLSPLPPSAGCYYAIGEARAIADAGKELSGLPQSVTDAVGGGLQYGAGNIGNDEYDRGTRGSDFDFVMRAAAFAIASGRIAQVYRDVTTQCRGQGF